MAKLIRDIQIGGSEGFLSFLDGFVEDLRVEYGLSEDVTSNIVISLSEALNNAYVHGNNKDESSPIALKVFEDEGSLVFTVEDNGSGFDFDLLRDDLAEDLIDVPGGRGIFIMRWFL